MTPFWVRTTGEALAQGDYLPDCPIPMFPPDFSTTSDEKNVLVELADVVIVTQSCDLENRKVLLAALCPIFTLEQFGELDQRYRKLPTLEEIRKGRFEGLHMLASPEDPADNKKAVVVDFRQIFSLPVDYLSAHARSLGGGWRLQSPFLEHFSQAFARFFMRVGLPSAIAPFK